MTTPKPSALEAIAVHLVTWWGIRILTSQSAVLHRWEPDTPGWYWIRLGRAALVLMVVAAWARYRGVSLRDLGLGGPSFRRNAISGFAIATILWFGIAILRGKGFVAPSAPPYDRRALALLTSGVDILAQQVPTFGLLTGLLGSSWWPVVLAWASFTAAHLVGSSREVVIAAAFVGAIFVLLRRFTGNLGAGLGVHAAYYAWLAMLGWGLGGR